MYVIRTTNGLSQTGYNYWKEDVKVAVLDLDAATRYETEEAAIAASKAITDVVSPRGNSWFDICTAEQAELQWHETLGRAGANHNPYRHTEGVKGLVSPNQVMLGVMLRGVMFDNPNFKDGDPEYLTILAEARKDVLRRKELDKYIDALKVAVETKSPDQVSDATLREWLVDALAWIFHIVLQYADEDRKDLLQAYYKHNVVEESLPDSPTTSNTGLKLVTAPSSELLALAKDVLLFDNPLCMDMQGMDWYIPIPDKVTELAKTLEVFPFEMESPISFTLIGTEDERSFAIEILNTFACTDNVHQAVNITSTLGLVDVLISAHTFNFTCAPFALMQLSGFLPWNSPQNVTMRQKLALEEQAAQGGFDVTDFVDSSN